MANRHFGKIGDVWKHLPLATIVGRERPAVYWESNAGSARYALTHSIARDYGAFHFLANAAREPVLAESAYYRVLREFAPEVYPGSPQIAMRVLGAETTFLFCDLDVDSLRNIESAAAELGLRPERVHTVARDGIAALDDALAGTADAAGVFAHLDPYLPFAASRNGLTTAGLFCRLAERHAQVMLWYGFSSLDEEAELMRQFTAAFAAHRLDGAASALWQGEIILEAMGDPDFDINPGVMGCGILCANLSRETRAGCEALGQALTRIYADAAFPGGYPGGLRFRGESW